VITGFNTDIQHNGVIYHIQTEDKGLETPLILSLVYIGGTILASKRSPYDDLIGIDYNEKELTLRLQRQHKLMCAAVKAGRIEDLKRMTAKQRQSKTSVNEEQFKQPQVVKSEVSLSPRIPKPDIALEEVPIAVQSGYDDFSMDFPNVLSERPIDNSIPKPSEELIWEVPDSAIKDLIIDDVEIIEEIEILPAEAVAIIEPFYTDAEQFSFPEQIQTVKNKTFIEKLTINLRKNISFRAGEEKSLEIFVNKGKKTKGLNGAHILVKVLGSSFRPLIFHGKTDNNGIAFIDLKLPKFKQGRAAILIKAMSEGEEVELRKTISQT
jgi:hypothetical protein